MSTKNDVTIESLPRPASDADLRGLAELLIDAVESGAAVSFVRPLSLERAESWWRDTLESADARALFLVARGASGLAGTVQLHPAWAPNQPHRAEIAKLLVHRRHRRQGLATRLMQEAEERARLAGFRLLTLDAKRGGAAERLYRERGWIEVGVIPAFALDPDGQSLHDDVIFYKELAGTPDAASGPAAFQSGDGPTTRIGYVNRNGQRCAGTLGVSGTDHGQSAYKLECQRCGHVYGANGTDVHERRCPACQSGAAGIPYWRPPTAG